MLDKLKNLILNKYLGSFVRHALTALVGLLIGSELPGIAQLAELIQANAGPLAEALTAALAGVAALIWSFKDKKDK